MNNRKEILMAEISAAGAITQADIKDLGSLMNTRIMQKFLCSYLVEADDAVTALANQDFTTDAGVKAALRIQAKANLLTGLVESAVELVTTEQPETESTTEGEPKHDD